MRNHLFYNHYDIVYGGYDWQKFRPNNNLVRCRTCQEADRDGSCKRCNFDACGHFLVSHDETVFTKLCILDFIKYRPVDFKMSMFGAEDRRPKPHEQLKLF